MITLNVKRHISIACLVSLLCACSNTSPVPTLPAGESIAIRQPVVKHVDSAVASKAQRAGRGAALGAVGAVGGAAVGSSMGGLLGFACGPAAIICVPIGLAAGAGIGGVGGGIVGVSYGARGGISGDKAEEFNEIAAELMDTTRLGNQLQSRFGASASRYWVLREDSANIIVLEVNSLNFEQVGGEDIQLSMKVQMRVASNGRVETVTVEQVGARRHIDYWLDREGENFQAEIDIAMREVVWTMVNRLVDHGPIAQR
jgi:hypothetical protein